jgi:cyclopropane fatty-acyl-phospholipid synthase-like methyltransferase
VIDAVSLVPRVTAPAGRRIFPGLEPFKFTTVAHRDHVLLSPIHAERLDRLIEMLALAPGDRVLDVGCGKGEMLRRVVERFDADGLGVDINPQFVAEAERHVIARASRGQLEFQNVAARELELEPTSLAAMLCMAASHAYGGFRPLLREARRLLCPGGLLLAAEGFWMRSPDPKYLALLEATPDELTTHEGNQTVALEEGFTVRHNEVASVEEWDDYEGRYAAAVERFTAEHPDDPDAPAMRDRIRGWRDGYTRWGRDTLGMGFYLLGAP